MRWPTVVRTLTTVGAAVATTTAAATFALAQAPTGVVTGRVTAGETGAPLPSTTVSVPGTRLGALTGPDGRFTIGGVPAGVRRVRAQRIGYGVDSATVTVTAGGPVTVDFALRPVATQLTAVVAIGYGTTDRRSLTTAVTSVTSEELVQQPSVTLDQALQGRAPGVQIVSQSGQPGAGALVRIRGGNSINASNEPLYVIDGVPMVANTDGVNTNTLQSQGQSGLNPLASLNPSDIESIDILKDAASTAIYGARAANGVVLITTKRGRAGRTTTSFGVYLAQQQVRRTLPLLDAPGFAALVNQARGTTVFTPDQIAGMGKGTDWQDAIFRSAPLRNFDVSLAGGTDATRYYLSANLLQSEGTVIGTNLDRGAFRLNLDQNVSDRVRVGARLTLSRSDGQVLPNGGAGPEQSAVVLNALLAPPTLPVRGADGEFFTGVNPINNRAFANPVATALEITNAEQQNRVVGNASAEVDVLRGMVLRTQFGADYLSSTQNYYAPSTLLPGSAFGGRGSRGNAQVTNWLNETTLNYKRSLGFVDDLDLLGGVTLQRTRADNISGTAQGFNTDRLRENNLNTGRTFVGVWTGSPESSLLSYFSRANLSVRDRYLLTLSGRVDGSSRFGEGNQYGFFPAAALAWRASREPFVQRLGLFDDLKVRLSYGRTGNQDIGNFASLATLGPVTYVFGNQRAIGFVPASLENASLRWETTDQLNAGLDVAVLKNRLFLTADVYSKKTKDLLYFVPLPLTSGFDQSLQNMGSVRNRGAELGINTVNLTGALGWTSSLNLTWNRNRVLDLGRDTLKIAPVGVGAGVNQNPTVLKVGEPVSSFYGFVFDRMVQGEGGRMVPSYRDLNGDGSLTDADRTIIGSAQPNYVGGLTNRFTYRSLALSVFLQWSQGNKIYNLNRALLTTAAGNANQLRDVLGNVDGIPSPSAGNSYDNRPSTLFVEDGSYLRGRNIRLDWTVPPALLRRAGAARLSGLQLYVSAQNFFTRTDYSGFDPEISEYAGSSLAQGFDFGTYPQPRTFTVGFTSGF